MANYYKNEGLDGYYNWYKVQAQEERDHALLFMDYIQQNGEAVVLEAIAKPDKEFKEFIDPLKAGAEHERYRNRADTRAYMQRHIRRTISGLCSSSTGSSRNRLKRRTLQLTIVKKFQLFGC